MRTNVALIERVLYAVLLYGVPKRYLSTNFTDLTSTTSEKTIIQALNSNANRRHHCAITNGTFLVPPVTLRPSITLESGERSEDDLTHKLSDVVRINQRLFENINAGAPEIIIEDLYNN